MNKKTIFFVLGAFMVFLFSFFVAGPWLQHDVIEPNQPYLIVDPEIKSTAGCEYDYLTYIPIEVTGRPPSEGIRFPIEKVPADYVQYVHYPESWGNPLNPFNPNNPLSSWIQNGALILTILLSVLIIAYLIFLWRKGVLKKMKDKFNGEE
jgi:hypothetical protein